MIWIISIWKRRKTVFQFLYLLKSLKVCNCIFLVLFVFLFLQFVLNRFFLKKSGTKKPDWPPSNLSLERPPTRMLLLLLLLLLLFFFKKVFRNQILLFDLLSFWNWTKNRGFFLPQFCFPRCIFYTYTLQPKYVILVSSSFRNSESAAFNTNVEDQTKFVLNFTF